MKPLDELVKAVAPVFGAAGFRKSGRRQLLMPPPGAPGNAVLASFDAFTGDPTRVGFHLEWAVIPSAAFAFHADSKSPSITWGVIADRVPAPPAFVTGSAADLWSYPISEGPDRCAVAVTEVLSTGLLDRLLSFQDRTEVLRAIDEGTLASGLPTEIPRGRPYRYLSMYIDDGVPAELETLLGQLQGAPPGNPFAAWWRERLLQR